MCHHSERHEYQKFEEFVVSKFSHGDATTSAILLNPSETRRSKKEKNSAPQSTKTSKGLSRKSTKKARKTSPQAKSRWGAAIRRNIARRKRMPSGIKASGTVKIMISVSSTGRLVGSRITKRSGHAALDQAAIAAVRQARYPKAPKGVAKGTHHFAIPITFSR